MLLHLSQVLPGTAGQWPPQVLVVKTLKVLEGQSLPTVIGRLGEQVGRPCPRC